MIGLKRIFYKLYIFILALWMGGSVYNCLAESSGWYEDPVNYIDHITSYPPPGYEDPLNNITGCLVGVTIICLLIFIIYHGPGRRTALISLTGTLAVLVLTYAYFIPVRAKLFDESQAFNDQVINMSRTWIILNYIRLFFTVILFFISLVALSVFKSRNA